MTKQLRELRLIPIVLVAVGSLFVLKLLGLVVDGGYTLGQRLGSNDKIVVTTIPASPSVELRSPSISLYSDAGQKSGDKTSSWMQEMFNYRDVTGSVNAPKPAAKDTAKEAADKKEGADKAAPSSKAVAENNPAAAKNPPPAADSKAAAPERTRPVTAAERAVLERLQERRKELDALRRELDVRESMIKAAESKLDRKPPPKNAGDARAADDAAQAEPTEKVEESPEAKRMKALVTMYEAMKPKDAARIFDRLDAKVLLDIARSMNPRQLSEVLAQMKPEAAERLTIDLATATTARNDAENPVDPATLPKIVGKPNGG